MIRRTTKIRDILGFLCLIASLAAFSCSGIEVEELTETSLNEVVKLKDVEFVANRRDKDLSKSDRQQFVGVQQNDRAKPAVIPQRFFRPKTERCCHNGLGSHLRI